MKNKGYKSLVAPDYEDAPVVRELRQINKRLRPYNCRIEDAHPLFERIIATCAGFPGPAPSFPRDGCNAEGEFIEVKVRTTSNADCFNFHNLSQQCPADVFVLVGWFKNVYQFFVLPGYELNEHQGRYSMLARPSKYRRIKRENRRRWKVQAARLKEEVDAALRKHREVREYDKWQGTLGNRALTNEQAFEIRKAYASGNIQQKELAERYGVTASVIHMIVYGKRYSDAGGPVVEQ